jgi:hypothetical protein
MFYEVIQKLKNYLNITKKMRSFIIRVRFTLLFFVSFVDNYRL